MFNKLGIILVILACTSQVWAAQSTVSSVSFTDPTKASIKQLKDAVNTYVVAAVNANANDAETRLGSLETTASSLNTLATATLTCGAADMVPVWDGSAWGCAAQSGGGSGDNLGTATYADVAALWASGSCSGYLKSDGTCDTPSGSFTYPDAGIPLSTGSAWGTSITLGAGVATAMATAVDSAGGFASYSGLVNPDFSSTYFTTSLDGTTLSITIKGNVLQPYDADLDDLADGSLSLSKLGAGQYVVDDCTSVSNPATGAICFEY